MPEKEQAVVTIRCWINVEPDGETNPDRDGDLFEVRRVGKNPPKLAMKVEIHRGDIKESDFFRLFGKIWEIYYDELESIYATEML